MAKGYAISKDTELQDKIHVTVNVNRFRFPTKTHPALYPAFRDIRERLNKVKRLKTTIGRKVANKAKENQMNSIQFYDAVCTGNLYGSIRVNGSGGEYTVGTNSEKEGYHYLIHGRGEIDLSDDSGRFMIYPHKCTGTIIKTKYVGPAAPKNYMNHSRPKTQSDIRKIVQEEINNVMGK